MAAFDLASITRGQWMRGSRGIGRYSPAPMASSDELVPSASELKVLRSFASRRNFKRAGERFLSAAERSGLQPQHRVLDLGCGPGRFAVALSQYLDEQGSYVGLDVSRDAIEICNRRIGSRLPSFEFVWADVTNPRYSYRGTVRAAEYRFPFQDESFDFAFSNSLFTHLLPADTAHYIGEIGRVLRPSGRTLNTIFLLNDDSRDLLAQDDPAHELPFTVEGVARVKDAERPEAWIAVEEDFVRDAHRAAGLRIEEVQYGAWPGRDARGVGFGKKDALLAVKR
jgi:ubiquinone/menaquinone biosynthesis C-methylase UbiE